jgi:hypothetical protein
MVPDMRNSGYTVWLGIFDIWHLFPNHKEIIIPNNSVISGHNSGNSGNSMRNYSAGTIIRIGYENPLKRTASIFLLSPAP